MRPIISLRFSWRCQLSLRLIMWCTNLSAEALVAQFDTSLKVGKTAINLPVQIRLRDLLIMKQARCSLDCEVRYESQRPNIHYTHPRVCGLFYSGIETSDYPGLKRKSAAVSLLGLRVRIPPGAWMPVTCECCVLSGWGLCEWCVCVWSRKLKNGRPGPEYGRSATKKNENQDS